MRVHGFAEDPGMTDPGMETRVHIRQLEQELLDLEKNRKLLPKEAYENEKARIRGLLGRLSKEADDSGEPGSSRLPSTPPTGSKGESK